LTILTSVDAVAILCGAKVCDVLNLTVRKSNVALCVKFRRPKRLQITVMQDFFTCPHFIGAAENAGIENVASENAGRYGKR